MLKKEYSLYLDLVRFLAAAIVVVNHSNHRELITSLLPQLGHSAVMIFFVLSGFVIAFVTATREADLRAYSVSRLARIYSVVPVAIAVTLLADYVGEVMNPAFYQTVSTHDYWWLRLVTSFFMLNEVWHISITTYSNVPYWSLNYEVWYYAMFAMVTFFSGKTRFMLVGATVLLLGPKILLLAPIWWLGVYLYHSKFFAEINEMMGWLLFVGSLVLIYVFHAAGVREIFGGWLEQQIGSHAYKELAYSKSFLSDYVLALLVFANFAGFRAICHRFTALLVPPAKVIKYLAGYTFVLYLTHQPLIWLFKTLIDGNPDEPYFLFQVWALTGVTVWLLGHITERRKSSYVWLAQKVIDALSAMKGRVVAKS